MVDVGGGTSDFSLIAVTEQDGDLQLTRLAVGDHILLGGDNMPKVPFDTIHLRETGGILDRVTGSDPKVTDYILERPAMCPKCKREIFEKTLIEPR